MNPNLPPVLNLVVLRVPELERAKAFYECFGWRFVKHAHGKGPEHYAAESAGLVFELYPQNSDDASPRSWPARRNRVAPSCRR